MSTEEIYQGFIDWLRQIGRGHGLPEADEVMPLIQAACTPDEASLLTGIPFSGKYLEELSKMKQTAPDQLTPQLDAMARKGLLFRTVRRDRVRYSLNDGIFMVYRSGFWGGGDDERSKSMAPWANQYYYHGLWDQFRDTQTKIMRVVPIQRTIEDPRQIRPYEELGKVLDQQDYFTVSICPCRHRKNIDPEFPDCKYPTETCLHFGQLGHYIVENGLGREITRQETEEILLKCAKTGLVHNVANVQKRPDTICNCYLQLLQVLLRGLRGHPQVETRAGREPIQLPRPYE